MIGIRDALAQMMWPKSFFVFDDKSNVDLHLFTQEELSSQPLKWLKYLLLSKVGLQPIEEVCQQIKRFPMADYQEAKRWCEQALEDVNFRSSSSMVIIKIVPWGLAVQLKHYRNFKPSDVGPSFDKIVKEFGKTNHELWCCQSSIDSGTLSMGGRITYPNSVLEQQLELVWYASPKWLESISFTDFPFPYIRGTKSSSEISFTPQFNHIPSKGEHVSVELSTLLGDYRWVEDQVNSRRKSIEALLEILYGFGAKEVVLCFKVSDGKLTFIDWDTEIESTSVW